MFQVGSLAREALLTLLLGRPFMSHSVWTAAAECWAACLPDLQVLADPSSSLGRAVDQTFEAVCDKNSPEVSGQKYLLAETDLWLFIYVNFLGRACPRIGLTL